MDPGDKGNVLWFGFGYKVNDTPPPPREGGASLRDGRVTMSTHLHTGV